MMMFFLTSMILFCLSIFMFIFSLLFKFLNLNIFIEWFLLSMNSSYFNMYIYIDWMTLMFMFTVMMISSMIMIYSFEYMYFDEYKLRFYYLLLLFILSMMLMIISPSMVSILIGWDGLGLISYCLVIYYQNFSSYNSGMLTVLLNRIGDIMIILSISMMFIWGSWNFLNMNWLNNILFFLIIIASFTKSAQFPFSSWLPMAMAAPTPVSALVHSSTLVTAGVYLLIRFNKLISLNNKMMLFIMITGLLTMMMAGFSAIYEYDLKKIIAYSTLSQLGLMMMILSMHNINLTFFHLVTHAMFKSMMFMCSGIMIHSMNNYQDIRFMGNLMYYMPMTSMMFMIGNLSLCGMPYFSGFYSKDQILEYFFFSNYNFLCYLLLLISTGLTVMYSIRLLYYLMFNNMKFFSYKNIYDSKLMNMSMMMLFFFTIFLGYFLNMLMFFNIEMMYLMNMEKIIIIIICFIYIFLGKMMFNLNHKFKNLYFMKLFFGKMWFLYNMNMNMLMFFFNLGKKYYLIIDKGWNEYYFKKSLFFFIYKMNWMNKINNMMIMNLMTMMCFLILIYLLINTMNMF